MKHLGQFIIEGGRVPLPFETEGGRQWYMRQPSAEEDADGKSAYRLGYNRVKSNDRLADLGNSEDDIEREARIRAAASELAYMLPILIEDATGRRIFDPFNRADMERFEALDQAVISSLAAAYWGPIQQAISEAKKKSARNFSIGRAWPDSGANGPSPAE
jgi:hypothetical protein